jgi:DNA-directed RNA polymerase beta subunit
MPKEESKEILNIPAKLNSRKPINGQNAVGGLRMGEMERDAFISHGATFLITEFLFYS